MMHKLLTNSKNLFCPRNNILCNLFVEEEVDFTVKFLGTFNRIISQV